MVQLSAPVASAFFLLAVYFLCFSTGVEAMRPSQDVRISSTTSAMISSHVGFTLDGISLEEEEDPFYAKVSAKNKAPPSSSLDEKTGFDFLVDTKSDYHFHHHHWIVPRLIIAIMLVGGLWMSVLMTLDDENEMLLPLVASNSISKRGHFRLPTRGVRFDLPLPSRSDSCRNHVDLMETISEEASFVDRWGER
jgi:hypothetical protein